MTFDDLDSALRGLRVDDRDAGRGDRTRRACHAVLERRRPLPRLHRRVFPAARIHAGATLAWLEPSAALALSGVYLAAAVQLSVAFLRAFRV